MKAHYAGLYDIPETLVPEKMEISHEMLSPYQQQLKEDLRYKTFDL